MSDLLNTNTLHNALNVLIALLAAVTAALLATGCTTVVATGAIECSQSWINPAYTSVAIAVLGGLKTIVNIWRDGFSGLVKPQPPVQK